MRITNYKNLNEQFIKRSSPRVFSNNQITKEELETMIEAARFAPSCFNDQPWIFFLPKTQKEHLTLLSLLNSSNLEWASKASTIMFLGARKHFEHNGKINEWSKFDAGAAWMSMALQANSLGFSAHAMAGVKFDQAYRVMGIDQNEIELICAIAIGKNSDQELKYSTRKNLSEIIRYV